MMDRISRICLGSMIIIAASIALGLLFNAVRHNGLPLIKKQSLSSIMQGSRACASSSGWGGFKKGDAV
jgi:hypothetical protein